MRAWVLGSVLVAAIPAVFAMQAMQAMQATRGTLTIDALIDIKHPSSETWSPDGQSVAFLWDRGGVQNVWIAAVDGGQPRALTSFESDPIDSLDWAADGKSLLFLRHGQLMRVAGEGGSPQPVWAGAAPIGAVTLSPDRTRAALVRDGELYVRPLAGGKELPLAPKIAGVTGAAWSSDGSHLVFEFAKSKRADEAASYAGSKVVFTRSDANPSRVAVVAASGGAVTMFPQSPGGEGSPRWLGNERVVVQRMSEDLRSREIIVGDAKSGAEKLLHRDTDPKFWSLTFLNSEPIPSPDGKWVAFVSDTDGWDHLYVAAADGTPAEQVSRGRFEVTRFSWSPDSTRIAFDRNEPDRPGSRHLVVATRGGTWASAKLETITTGRGTNTNARWSPDGRHLLFEHTDARNSPDLYVVAVPASGRSDATARNAAVQPRRLTDSMPAAIDRGALVEPELVRYPAQDGAQVPAYLFVPPGLDRARKHPAIVWVHGDGINQNYDGWHIHRDYGVLQRPSVPAAERVRRAVGRLPRQHRVRARLATGTLSRSRREGLRRHRARALRI